MSTLAAKSLTKFPCLNIRTVCYRTSWPSSASPKCYLDSAVLEAPRCTKREEYRPSLCQSSLLCPPPPTQDRTSPSSPLTSSRLCHRQSHRSYNKIAQTKAETCTTQHPRLKRSAGEHVDDGDRNVPLLSATQYHRRENMCRESKRGTVQNP